MTHNMERDDSQYGAGECEGPVPAGPVHNHDVWDYSTVYSWQYSIFLHELDLCVCVWVWLISMYAVQAREQAWARHVQVKHECYLQVSHSASDRCMGVWCSGTLALCSSSATVALTSYTHLYIYK